MREDFGYTVKNVSDHLHKELKPEEVYDIFKKEYVNLTTPYSLIENHFVQADDIKTTVTISVNGEEKVLEGAGNGRLDAVSNALKENLGLDFTVAVYTEHALESSSRSRAVAYVGIEAGGKTIWGAGVHNDIMDASIRALLSAVNRMQEQQ